jgi:2-polyprenyl-3-methyl-5-hydroxy-6-metoxy-1,4-benzoquinol methylase
MPRGACEICPYPATGIELGQIERYASLAGRRVLEIGCGDGRLTLQLARRAAHVVAIDPDASQIAAARDAAIAKGVRNVEFLREAGEDMQPIGAPFDLAVFSWSL